MRLHLESQPSGRGFRRRGDELLVVRGRVFRAPVGLLLRGGGALRSGGVALCGNRIRPCHRENQRQILHRHSRPFPEGTRPQPFLLGSDQATDFNPAFPFAINSALNDDKETEGDMTTQNFTTASSPCASSRASYAS